MKYISIVVMILTVVPSIAHAAKKENEKQADITVEHKVDPAIIAAHVSDIVKDVIVLAKRSDDERKIGPIIVRLFNSILQIILAATHRRLPADTDQAELQEFLDTLDEHTAQEIQRHIILRTKRLMMVCEE